MRPSGIRLSRPGLRTGCCVAILATSDLHQHVIGQLHCQPDGSNTFWSDHGAPPPVLITCQTVRFQPCPAGQRQRHTIQGALLAT